LSLQLKNYIRPKVMGLMERNGILRQIVVMALAFSLLLGGLLSVPLDAAESKKNAEAPKSNPIKISSELMETEDGSRVVVFKGNVIAVRGHLTLNSDELRIVNFQSSGQMEKMVATGNVRLNYGERVAYADKAVYFNKEDKVELYGNPRVLDGENQITGEVMELFLKEGKSVVRGSKDVRVKVVFYPREE